MKLYYAPAACSLAPHIALSEAGLPHSSSHRPAHAHAARRQRLSAVNPKGYVPVLELDDGSA